MLRGNLKWKLIKRIVRSCVVLMLALGTIGCDRSPIATPSLGENTVTQSAMTDTDGPLSEVNIPESIAKLAPSLAKFQPQVRILSPQPDRILTDDRVSVKLQVSDFPLFKNPELGLGSHLHVILDKGTYQGVYDLTQPLVFENLAPGTHTLRVFASRPWHESFKNAGAYAQTTFHVFTKTAENNPEPQQPLLTYSRPAGVYGAEPIMLDYYLTNISDRIATDSPARLPDWKVRVTINNQKFIVDRWAPIYLQGFKQGKNWVRLELLDDRGNSIPNVYNDTVSAFSYDPQKKDSLAKLIQGEIEPNLARTLVDPNYVALGSTPSSVLTTPARSTILVPPANSSLPAIPPSVVSPLPNPIAIAPTPQPSTIITPVVILPTQPKAVPTPIESAPTIQPSAIPTPATIDPSPQPHIPPTSVAIAPTPQPSMITTPVVVIPTQPKVVPTPVESAPTPQPSALPTPVTTVTTQPKVVPTPVESAPTPQPSALPTPVTTVTQLPSNLPSTQPISIPVPVIIAPQQATGLPSAPAIEIDRPDVALAPATIPVIINPTPVAIPTPTAKTPVAVRLQPILVPIPVVIAQPPTSMTPPDRPAIRVDKPAPSSLNLDRPQAIESEPPEWQTKTIEIIKFLGVKIRAFTNTLPEKAHRFGHNVQIWSSQAIELVRSWRTKEAG